MATAGVEYYDGDRSATYTPDDVSAPNHGAPPMISSSSIVGHGDASIPSFPYDPSAAAGGYDDQQQQPYSVDGRSEGEHELDHHHDLSPNGDVSEYALVPHSGGYEDYSESQGPSTLVPEENEPNAELGDYVEDPVQPGFDEAILRALCDMDVGVPLLLDRIKQSMTSCREASVFLKKRAVLEEEYGRGLQKLARQSSEVYAMSDGKAGTFVSAWHQSMKIHEIVADNRIKVAARLNEMSDELSMLVKEVDKNRKGTKDLAARYERTLQDSEQSLEKIRARHDGIGDELQRFLVSKEGESLRDAGMSSSSGSKGGNKRVIGKAMTKGGMLLKGRNPANQQRQEEDIRGRLTAASDQFRKNVLETQKLRQEYFNFQLPRILRALKECADEIDLGLQYHLSRYAYLMENTALQDGSTIAPGGVEDGPGIKAVFNSIDNQQDFKVYMQNYAVSHAPKGPRREGPWEEGFLPPIPTHHNATQDRFLESQSSVTSPTGSVSAATHKPSNSASLAPSSPSRASSDQFPPSSSPNTASSLQPSRPSADARTPRGRGPTFGIYLADQMQRDAVEVPRIVEKCCDAIRDLDAFGSVGIYRLSGQSSKIQKLKAAFDRDLESVDLMQSEWASDINTITSTLKLWFRELPEPLLTYPLYSGFIEAGRIENDRLRHIRLHERVNELPDPNYATLKYLMGHLSEVASHSSVNQMHASNIAIVFGPTLLGPPTPARNASVSTHNGTTEGSSTLADMSWQCKAVETILEHYRDIFVDEGEEA